MQIESGIGNGRLLAVDDTNRAKVRAVTESTAIEAATEGEQFIITSGSITLTNASASAVLWFQNEQDYDLIMDRIIFSAGVSTGGTTNVCTIASKINPTGLTSGASTEAIDINSNFGSTKTLDTSSSEVGAQGATIDGGNNGPAFYFPDKLTSTFETQVVLQKGTGIAFTVTPPTSNTSLAVSIAINVHRALGLE
jgi:hypothetical protein